MKKEKITGIILAGGKSRRMGFDKGLAEINGKTSIEYVANILQKAVDDIIVISNNDSYRFLGYPIYKDMVKECGPIGGVYTGLSVSKTKKNLFVACDMPFVSQKMLAYILKKSPGYEIVVPSYKNKIQPLCAYYDKSICKQIYFFILNNLLSMKEVIRFFNYRVLQLDYFPRNELFNINTTEELSKARKIY